MIWIQGEFIRHGAIFGPRNEMRKGCGFPDGTLQYTISSLIVLVQRLHPCPVFAFRVIQARLLALIQGHGELVTLNQV